MTTAHRFVAVRLSERLPGVEVTVEWPEEQLLRVAVALDPRGASGSYERTFRGLPPNAERLQSSLRELPFTVAAPPSPRYSLVLSGRRASPELVSWSEPEPAALAGVRATLDSVGLASWAQARALLRRGLAERKQSDWSQALADLHRGLRVLGEGYAGPGVIDDTGQMLALAGGQERSGQPDLASAVLAKVLRNRLALYLRAHMARDPNEAWDE